MNVPARTLKGGDVVELFGRTFTVFDVFTVGGGRVIVHYLDRRGMVRYDVGAEQLVSCK